ncbi:MAG: hypothetical protein Q9208_007809 [Pyrenodesmia sp. 3 TL-2023]
MVTINYRINGYAHEFSILNPSVSTVKSSTDYNEYRRKGERALDMILHDPPSTRVWTRQDEDDAWCIYEYGGDISLSLGLAPVLEALGISADPVLVTGVFVSQNKEFTGSDGQIHPRTDGIYNNYFIPSAWAGRAVPLLHRWSDIVWLHWSTIAGDDAHQLRYIVRENVRTPGTRSLIEHLELEAEPDNLHLPWPGHIYNMSSPNGLALLGSMHGTGVAFLLKDHSDVLGRRIPTVRIFTVPCEGPSEDPPHRRAYKWLYSMIWDLRKAIDG